jgi:hypothetical protein
LNLNVKHPKKKKEPTKKTYKKRPHRRRDYKITKN